MVIKRKRVNASSNLVEVEADAADTVDTNGLTTVISAVGAKSAKFSGGADMTPNSGKRVGTLKTIIKTGNQNERTGLTIESSTVSNDTNAIDGNTGTFTGTLNGLDTDDQRLVVVDFGTTATAEILVTVKFTNSGSSNNNTGCKVYYGTGSNPTTEVYTVTNLDTDPSQTHNLSGQTKTFRYVAVALNNMQPTSDVTCAVGEVHEQGLSSGTTTVKIRASNTKDTADGTVLVGDTVRSPNTSLTLDTDLFLVESGQFYTLEIVSFDESEIDVNLETITSIKEVT